MVVVSLVMKAFAVRNKGAVDRLVRFWGGVLMLAFAFKVGFPETGWNAVGLVGIVPILTSFAAACPAYRLIGLNTRPAKYR